MSARSMIAMRVMRHPQLGSKFARARLASARRSREPASVEDRSRMASTTQQTPIIPAKAGIQGRGLGPRFRGDERKSERTAERPLPENVAIGVPAERLPAGNRSCIAALAKRAADGYFEFRHRRSAGAT